MKPGNIMLIFFLLNINAYCEEISDIIKTHQWRLPIEDSVIRFLDNNTYKLGHPMWDGFFCSGTYELDNHDIKIYYPNNLSGYNNENPLSYQKNVLDWMFSNNKMVVFTYDAAYIDFYTYTCLRNGTKILRNFRYTSPYGQEYELEGVKVIKYNDDISTIVTTDNVRMREFPDINAKTKNVPVYIQSESRDLNGNILYKNSVNLFNAKTVKEDTIDGITAPWYHVLIPGFEEGPSHYVWVFGGYVKELSEFELSNENLMNKYAYEYYEVLLSRKLIKRNPYR
jgi:hypothetical protein